MQVPVEPSSLLSSLRGTITLCDTFQRLMNAEDAGQANARVHDRFASDIPDDNGDPADSYPRCILEDYFEQTSELAGGQVMNGSGMLGLFIEFEQFSDSELSDWYSIAISGADDRDHLCHAKNLSTRIGSEIRQLGNPAGALTINRLIEHAPFRIDNVCNNAKQVWVIPFEFQWEGMP